MCFSFFSCSKTFSHDRVSPRGNAHGGHAMIFFWTPPPIKTIGHSHLKKKQTLKDNVPIQEMIPRKKCPKNQKLPLCFTHKTTLEKVVRNSTENWFSHFEHSKFHKKAKQFVINYYIALLVNLGNILYRKCRKILGFILCHV